MERIKKITLILAGLAALALGGAALAPADINPTKDGDDDEIVTGAKADEVGAAAVKQLGGGTVSQVERSDDDGREEYEVKVKLNGKTHEIEVAPDGRVLGGEIEDDDRDDPRDDQLVGGAEGDRIGKAALAEAPSGSKVLSVERDDAGYEVKLQRGTAFSEVHVNAEGKVTSTEADDDND